MKVFGFFLLLAGLVVGGFYFTEARFGELGMGTSAKGEILPADEWSSLLVGKWKYQRILRGTFFSWVYEGEVEYSSDGTFTKFITCKYYQGEHGTIAPSYLHVVAGGSYSGEWSVDTSDQFFNEEIQACDIVVSRADQGYLKKQVDFCETEFAPKSVLEFGNVTTNRSKFDLLRFDAKKIVIKGQMFAKGARVDIVFTKNE